MQILGYINWKVEISHFKASNNCVPIRLVSDSSYLDLRRTITILFLYSHSKLNIYVIFSYAPNIVIFVSSTFYARFGELGAVKEAVLCTISLPITDVRKERSQVTWTNLSVNILITNCSSKHPQIMIVSMGKVLIYGMFWARYPCFRLPVINILDSLEINS